VAKLNEAAADLRNQRYSASAGVYNLRREVSRKYQRIWEVQLDPNTEVIATIGSKEGFSHLMLALLGPGDTAVVGDPAFQIHTYAVHLAGGNVIKVPLGNDQAFLDRIEHVLRNLYPKPKVLILNYPHNPTTMCVDLTFWVKVVDMAKRHNVMVISDFAYGRDLLRRLSGPVVSAGAGGQGSRRRVHHHEQGLQHGRLAHRLLRGNAEMIKALATVKGYYDYGIFQAVQIASIIAMREHDDDVLSRPAIYQKRRDVLVELTRKLGWQVDRPRPPCSSG
jgi:alanine-synthesizing transaminase